MNLPQAPCSRPPVVLLAGYRDTGSKMARLGRCLRQRGREAHICAVSPSDGRVGIEVLAGQLETFVAQTLPSGSSFDLVGFSMGGLICRYYLQRLSGLQRVRKFVSVASPHRGSFWARFVNSPACRQMRPGSAFLKDLESDEHRLAEVGFVSFWTPWDLMILPARSSAIDAAQCRRLFCVAHPLMVLEPRCARAVVDVLEG